MLTKVIGDPTRRSLVLKGNHAPAANTAAIVTLAATANIQHCIHGIQWSYSVAPTGGRITITDGGTTIFDVDVASSGPGGFNFTMHGSTNSALVVTLASGTGTCVGKLNIQYTSESINSK